MGMAEIIDFRMKRLEKIFDCKKNEDNEFIEVWTNGRKKKIEELDDKDTNDILTLFKRIQGGDFNDLYELLERGELFPW